MFEQPQALSKKSGFDGARLELNRYKGGVAFQKMRGQLRSDIFSEVKNTLRDMERFGRPKYNDKLLGTTQSGIYSYSTAHAYSRECQRFAAWVAERSPEGRYTTLKDAMAYARSYIAQQNANGNLSASTVKLQRSALAKLYQCDARELGEVRPRLRSEISRSRERYTTSSKTGKTILNPSTRAGHFSESAHADEVAWARSTGMRRKEMELVRGDQLVVHSDGSLAIRMEKGQCKGGRIREIPVTGDQDTIKRLCDQAGSDKVFGKVTDRMDIHHYRAEYATSLYRRIARDPEQIPKEDRYYCRGDLKGVVYDKQAMLTVSEALGHSRINVIASHYLRT